MVLCGTVELGCFSRIDAIIICREWCHNHGLYPLTHVLCVLSLERLLDPLPLSKGLRHGATRRGALDAAHCSTSLEPVYVHAVQDPRGEIIPIQKQAEGIIMARELSTSTSIRDILAGPTARPTTAAGGQHLPSQYNERNHKEPEHLASRYRGTRPGASRSRWSGYKESSEAADERGGAEEQARDHKQSEEAVPEARWTVRRSGDGCAWIER